MPKTGNLTYEEVCNQVSDSDILTIAYDGIEKKGHWYEDHMLKIFSGCKLVRLVKAEYMVMEWPEDRTQCHHGKNKNMEDGYEEEENYDWEEA
jgi:hypothetical protein